MTSYVAAAAPKCQTCGERPQALTTSDDRLCYECNSWLVQRIAGGAR